MRGRRCFALLAFASVAALGPWACSSTSSTGSGYPDAASGDGSPSSNNPPGCPGAAPSNGAQCALADGTTCNYGVCGIPSATCISGSWSFAQARPGPCPDFVPETGASCCNISPHCSYDCAHGKGSNSTADCVDGKWKILQSASPCAAPDAGSD